MKSASVAVPVYFTNSPVRQAICMVFLSLSYIIMLFKYSPFANLYLNFSEKVSHMSLFCMYFSAILFLGSVDSSPIVEGFMRELLGISLCTICVLSILFTFWCGLCELAFLALVHRDQFASKWQAAVAPHFGNSVREGLPTPFVFLYVYYNAISRRDLGQKTRFYNEAVAEKLFRLELETHGVSRRGILFRIRCMWIYFIVGIEQKFLSMCNPSTVLAVTDSEEAKFLGMLSQLEYDMQQLEKTRTKFSKLWSKIRRCFCCLRSHRKIIPIDDVHQNLHMQSDHQLSAPQDFISNIFELKLFLKNTFSPSSRQTLICLFLFDRIGDFGSSPECLKYHSQLMQQFESAKTCLQALFSLENELLKKDVASEKNLRYFDRLANSLIGRDALIISAFNYTDNRDRIDTFKKFHFPDADESNCTIPSVDELVLKAFQSVDSEGSKDAFRFSHRSEILERTMRAHFSLKSNVSNVDAKSFQVLNPVLFGFECPPSCETIEYKGKLDENMYHGFGTALFCNGDRYEGYMSHGQRQGTGKFTWASGDTYNGEWNSDVFDGYGILQCDRFLFQGEWVHGKRAGKGKISFDCGDVYDGNWEGDSYNGDGQYKFADGSVLIGKWQLGNFVEESIASGNDMEEEYSKNRIIAGVSGSREASSMYEMMFPSQKSIHRREKTPTAVSRTTKLMQLLDDSEHYRKDIEWAEYQLQEIQPKIKFFEERCQDLRREESDLERQVVEVTAQVNQRKVQRQVEDIEGKLRRLREKRDTIVSEQNVRIIEVMIAEIGHLQNVKKELQSKLSVKRYRDFLKTQKDQKTKSTEDAIKELRAKIPTLQYELNQSEVEMAELTMLNFNLRRNVESSLQENCSLRSVLGLGPLQKSD
jgi:hypothetical protein